MPFDTNEDLPAGLRRHLPPHAQSIYREAFNHAWASYQNSSRQEHIAHRVAWAAVKKRYSKAGEKWVPRTSTRRSREARVTVTPGREGSLRRRTRVLDA
jgi:cation transport regulator